MQYHHSAPPVQYPVGRSRFQAVLLWGAGLLGALVLLAWALSSRDAGQPSWRVGLGAAACVASWGLAMASWRRTPTGTLMWDGMNWRFEAQVPLQQALVAESITAISIHLDFQAVILARLHGGVLDPLQYDPWLWLERRGAPARWKALRRALLANGPAKSARIGA